MNDTLLSPPPAPPPSRAGDPRFADQTVLRDDRDAAGRLLSRTPLLMGEVHGQVTHYGANEAPRTTVEYRHGRRHGELRCYDERGQVTHRATYRDDVRHGPTTLFSDARVSATQQFVDGLLHGETVCYAASGLVAARLPYRLGLLHGEATYALDGTIVRRATYHAGMLHGLSEDRDTAGRLVQSAHYRANVLHGVLRRYWPGGATMEETPYRDGKAAAPPRRFDAHGVEIAASAPGGRFVRDIEKWVRGG